MNARVAPPAGAQRVEMVDGRIFWSTDKWETAWLTTPAGKVRQLQGEQADFARFLAVSQSSWSGDAM